jgi:hypothetical protein
VVEHFEEGRLLPWRARDGHIPLFRFLQLTGAEGARDLVLTFVANPSCVGSAAALRDNGKLRISWLLKERDEMAAIGP